MSTSVLQIRLEDGFKKQVSDLFDRLGMDLPTAVRIFFKQALVEDGLPFEVKAHSTARMSKESMDLLAAMRALNEEAHQNGVTGMGEEDIEAEIKAARAERKKRK